MAQSATQRTTGATRLKGPTVITMRGAGSVGHDPLTKGAGLDVGLSVQIPTAQTANAFQIEKPDGTVIFQVDASGNIGSNSVLNIVSRKTQVTLTAANLIAMNGTPVSILAAPAAGIAIVVTRILFEMKRTATAFTSGGVITFQYHTATTTVHSGSIPASRLTTAGAANTLDVLVTDSPTNSLLCAQADGIDITNATAGFATGTGTAVVTIMYDLVTLQ